MAIDPESDDESVALSRLPYSLHTPNTSRSLCFELSSTVVCTFVLCTDCRTMDVAVLTGQIITKIIFFNTT